MKESREPYMPVMRWDAFNAAHPRPFMIFADYEEGRQSGFELLRRLAVSMLPRGNIALRPEKGLIRIAFELEADAKKFAENVQARKTAREGGWAGQWAFEHDVETQQAIDNLLAPIKSPGSPRAGITRKMKRRMLPI
jgi:hypothetical protein